MGLNMNYRYIDFTGQIKDKREHDTLDKPFHNGDGFGIYTKDDKGGIVRLAFSKREEIETFMQDKGYDWGPEKNRLTHFANERILIQINPNLEEARQANAADPQWNIPTSEVKLEWDGTSDRDMKDHPEIAVELRQSKRGFASAKEEKKSDKKNGKEDKKNGKEDKKNGKEDKKNGKEDKKNGKDEDSKEDKNGKKLPPWLNKKKSKAGKYSELYKKVSAKYSGDIKVGDNVKNINKTCTHFKSEGVVKKINNLPGDKGVTIAYQCTNAGKTWKEGDKLEKTPDQLTKGNCGGGKCIY
jgi:hypothetical protein